ncbi:DUF6241 domain-containing protein [Siminovitchia terrae]|uniref:DUF6241 domain-containing protein n=1 Tax=Siminovitchia terrae TaxID=1914933 RepID=UPI001B0FEBAD|nr:DUF6241 domain-containing protein [Siminovitchia terrae]GIN92507.1 hypothetical protein J22TS1_35580 [Siminovitchia terrae]
MFKKIIVKLIVLIIVIGGTIACSSKGDTNIPTIQDNVELNKEPEAEEKVPVQKIDNYVASEDELKHAAGVMGEINTEEDLASVMMAIALQKVELKENENFEIAGTIPPSRPQFTKGNIAFIKKNAESIKSDSALEKVLDKWSQGNFDDIDKDFVLARNILTGQDEHDGYKVKKRPEEEEERYIKHFYGNKGLKLDEEQWRYHEKIN